MYRIFSSFSLEKRAGARKHQLVAPGEHCHPALLGDPAVRRRLPEVDQLQQLRVEGVHRAPVVWYSCQRSRKITGIFIMRKEPSFSWSSSLPRRFATLSIMVWFGSPLRTVTGSIGMYPVSSTIWTATAFGSSSSRHRPPMWRR